MSILRVTTTAFRYGQAHQNVLHFNNPDGATPLATAATDVRDNWVNKVTIHLASTLRYLNILVQDITNPAEPAVSLAIDRLGQSFGDTTFASFACMVFKLQTDFGGRHGRGRVFLGGMAANFMTDGILNSGYIINVNNDIVAPIMARFGPSGTSNLELGVLQRGGGGPTLHPVQSIQVRSTMGVQRRRNIGVGV